MANAEMGLLCLGILALSAGIGLAGCALMLAGRDRAGFAVFVSACSLAAAGLFLGMILSVAGLP